MYYEYVISARFGDAEKKGGRQPEMEWSDDESYGEEDQYQHVRTPSF